MIIMWLEFLATLLIAIAIHEIGHMVVALACGVKVDAFSIGFGKPIISKKIKGIDFRLSWILLGGYCKLHGELARVKRGFMIQPYWKKFLILVAGVTMNLILACVCYQYVYGDILHGMAVDWAYVKALCTKDFVAMYAVYDVIPVGKMFMAQLGLINFFCAITNLIPYPALDGGWIVILAFEKRLGKKFLPILKALNAFGFVTLMILQVWLLYWLLT